jgi:hypothetical protein
MGTEEVNESTETTEAAGAEADPADEVIVEGIELAPADDKPEAETAATETEEKPKVEPTDLEKRLAEIEKNYTSASTHIKDLQKALHQTRQENKALKEGKAAEPEAQFTDAQLKQILEEHGNDWGVVLNVLNQKVKQETLKTKAAVVDDVETKQIKANLDGFLERELPEIKQEGSELRTQVDATKEKMRLGDHPYGDFLASAAILMTNWKKIQTEREEALKKELLGDKVETKRKEVVKQTSISSKGSKAGETGRILPADVAGKAKQMGLNKRQTEIYAKLLKGGKKMAATVEA